MAASNQPTALSVGKPMTSGRLALPSDLRLAVTDFTKERNGTLLTFRGKTVPVNPTKIQVAEAGDL